MKYKVLIIGAGNIASGYDDEDSDMFLTHAHAFKYHDGFELLGFVDIDKKKANIAAKKWGTNAFFNLESAIQKFQYIDIFCIAVPDVFHYEILLKVAALKPKFVFAEKPLTQTLSESLIIKNLYSINTIPLMVNFKRAFIPEFKFLEYEIKNNCFGKLRDFYGFYNRGLKHNASHLFDLFFRLTGEKDLILTQFIDQINDYSLSDLSYSFLAKSNSGVNFNLKSFNGNEYPIFELDFHFSAGRIRVTNAGEIIEKYKKQPSSFNGLTTIKLSESIVTSLNKSFIYSIQNIYNHLTSGEKVVSDIDDTILVMGVTEKIIKSINKYV